MNKEVLRLAVLLACVALAASRFGLIGHELVGHGGVALAFGADIVDVKMFWFAGGWIRYVLPEPALTASLVIAMAGIVLELVVGMLLALVVRRRTLGGVVMRGIGLALVVHGTWYLATGAFHGFGDGLLLYRQLGPARVPVAVAAGLSTCAASFVAARGSFGPLAATLPGTRRARIVGLVVAMLLGSGLHAALTIGELGLRRDSTYVRVMEPERERLIAHELLRWQQQQPGVAPSEDATRAQRASLEKKHEGFPFVIVLAAATLASVLAGAWRARWHDGSARASIENRLDNRLLGRTVAIALTAIWLVIVIDGAIK